MWDKVVDIAVGILVAFVVIGTVTALASLLVVTVALILKLPTLRFLLIPLVTLLYLCLIIVFVDIVKNRSAF